MSRPPESPASALALIDEWWPAWNAFLDEQAARHGEGERGADGWTLAEAIAHVARWHQWCVARIAHLADGGRVDNLDVDGMNAAWAAEDQGISLADARARAADAHAAFRQAVAAVPAERWTPILGRLVRANSSEHYQEHMGWRARAG